MAYNGLNKGPYPVAFDCGYTDTPFTLDEATSSNDIMFVGRASIQTVPSTIFANDFRSALGVRSNADRDSAGVLRDRAAIRRDARHRRAIRRLWPRHLSGAAGARLLAACRRRCRRVVEAALGQRHPDDYAVRPAGNSRRSDRDPQHRRVGHGREPGKRFIGSSWSAGIKTS